MGGNQQLDRLQNESVGLKIGESLIAEIMQSIIIGALPSGIVHPGVIKDTDPNGSFSPKLPFPFRATSSFICRF